MLENDLKKCVADVESALPWARDIGEIRWRVLIDMRFQLGLRGLLNFKRMLAAAEKRDWPTAANEMLDSNWARQTPGRAQRLAMMVLSGEDSADF